MGGVDFALREQQGGGRVLPEEFRLIFTFPCHPFILPEPREFFRRLCLLDELASQNWFWSCERKRKRSAPEGRDATMQDGRSFLGADIFWSTGRLEGKTVVLPFLTRRPPARLLDRAAACFLPFSISVRLLVGGGGRASHFPSRAPSFPLSSDAAFVARNAGDVTAGPMCLLSEGESPSIIFFL